MQGAPPQNRKRLPHFQTVCPNYRFCLLREKRRTLRNGREKGMARNHQFCTPPGRAHRCCAESRLSASATSEDEFARADAHAVQLGGVVQAEQPALHSVAHGELIHHCGNVPPGALHSAGSVQLREESKEHATSLPSTAQENKNPLAPGFRGLYATV
jgi:hypothetical protein